MATTPSVVPTARMYFCVVVMSMVPRRAPGTNAKARNVAVAIRLLAIGANIGAANFRRAFSRPVATPAPSP